MDWLIIYTALRPAQEFFTYMETSPLPVKGYKIQAFPRRSGPLSRGDLYRVTPAVTRNLGFSGLIRRTAPIRRLLRTLDLRRGQFVLLFADWCWLSNCLLRFCNDFFLANIFWASSVIIYSHEVLCNDSLFVSVPVRIRVRIDPSHPLVCCKRRLNGAVLRMETGKTEVPCHSRCSTIKIPPCSKALSADNRPKFWSPLPAMVTSPHKWNICERDVKP
jgi:hypothetical protein